MKAILEAAYIQIANHKMILTRMALLASSGGNAVWRDGIIQVATQSKQFLWEYRDVNPVWVRGFSFQD